MVGIAGEDDLEAPDLNEGSASPSGFDVWSQAPAHAKASQGAPQVYGKGARRSGGARVASPRLGASESGQARESLLLEIKLLSSEEQASEWAKEALHRKNVLTDEDSKSVDVAFEKHLLDLSATAASNASSTESSAATPRLSESSRAFTDSDLREETSGIDKSVLAIPEPKRHRNKAHLKFVAQHPCLICERQPADAHQLRYAQPRALGRKTSDEFTVPLCRIHHRELHRVGDERKWWQRAGIDPLPIAQALWAATCGLPNSTNGGPAKGPATPVAVQQAAEQQTHQTQIG
jgi:hypothetical protein